MFSDTYYDSGHHCTRCGKHFCRCETPEPEPEPDFCYCKLCEEARKAPKPSKTALPAPATPKCR